MKDYLELFKIIMRLSIKLPNGSIIFRHSHIELFENLLFMSKPIIVMGVSGCGKSTMGDLIAKHLGFHFYDADDFHPEGNKEKMANGVPLSDSDRRPWLEQLAQLLTKEPESVLACSALKESYRKLIDPEKQYHWVYLKGSRDLIFNRMNARKNHFMKPYMLDSQFATLEEPKNAITVSIEKQPEEILEEVLGALGK